jgi:hypothetical protein
MNSNAWGPMLSCYEHSTKNLNFIKDGELTAESASSQGEYAFLPLALVASFSKMYLLHHAKQKE